MEFVSTMNPHTGTRKSGEKLFVVVHGKMLRTSWVSTRDYEYADSARSYIGFEPFRITWVQRLQEIDLNSI